MAGVPGSHEPHEPAGHILDALVTRLCIPRVPRVPGVTRLTIITDIRQFPSSSDPSQALQSDTLSAGEHSLLLCNDVYLSFIVGSCWMFRNFHLNPFIHSHSSVRSRKACLVSINSSTTLPGCVMFGLVSGIHYSAHITHNSVA